MKKKDNKKYLNIATNLLTHVYENDTKMVCNIVCSQADKDYEYIYNSLEALEKNIIELKNNLKVEGNL